MKEPKLKLQSKSKKEDRSKPYLYVTYFFFILFVILMAYFARFIIVDSRLVLNNTYNKRTSIFERTMIRGDISANDGTILAQTTVSDDGVENRTYPYGDLYAHVIGYASLGQMGVEQTGNYNLLTSHDLIWNRLEHSLNEQQNKGDTLVTTIDPTLQKASYDALGNDMGAIIAMDPDTGEIKALVSKPDFDPNKIEEQWDNLLALDSVNSKLVNRATQGSYAPGSTFKIATTLDYIREYPNTYKDFTYTCTGSVTEDSYTIPCYGNEAHGQENLEQAFAHSCNSAYATIGLSLNPTSFNHTCEDLLYGKTLPYILPYTQSVFQLGEEPTTAATMETAIGQGKTTVSPYHLMLISAAIANDGELMTPYIIDYYEAVNGSIVNRSKQQVYDTLMSKSEAQVIASYMQYTVQNGTASKLQSNSYEAYGKTGTAQVSDSSNQANGWFTGYAIGPEGNKLSIAVIVENSGVSTRRAVPAAKKVFDSYYN